MTTSGTIATTSKVECFVYIDYKPDGEPFYVGIGGKRRIADKRRRNKFHASVCAKHPRWVRKVVEEASIDNCKEFEQLLITSIGRRDKGTGPLVNHTDGGDGVWGRVVGEIERENNPAKRPENRKSSSARMTLNNPMKDPLIVKKVSEALTGSKHSEETKEKRRRSNKGRKPSAETSAKISASLKGKPRPYARGENSVMRRPEVAAKVSLAQKGKKLTKEHVAALTGSHVGNKWIVNVSTGETLMRAKEIVVTLLATGEWKYGRKL